MDNIEKKTPVQRQRTQGRKAPQRRSVANILIRNLILAVSLLVIALFVVQIMLSVFTRHNKYKQVPEFTGMHLTEALQAAEDYGLRMEINDSLYVPAFDGGTVLEQKPVAGTEVKSGRRIFVTVNSYHQKMVTVPYVTGYSLRQAKNNLESVGLEIAELRFEEDIAANYVLGERVNGQEVREGSDMQVELGSGVVLTIGMNETNTTAMMPDLTGLVLREAKSRIWENGFNVGNINMDADIDMNNQNTARVYGQTPQPGEFVNMGQRITLRLTLDDAKVAQTAAAVRELMEQQAEERRKAEEEAAMMEGAQGQIGSIIESIVGGETAN